MEKAKDSIRKERTHAAAGGERRGAERGDLFFMAVSERQTRWA